MAIHRRIGVLLLLGMTLVAAACGTDGGGQQTTTARQDRSAPVARTTPPPRAARPAESLTHAALIGRIAGRTIDVAGRRIRIDRATLTCRGVGQPVGRPAGRPAWTRFRCVQPTFPAGAVAGPDAVFVVHGADGRGVVVESGSITTY